MASNEAKNEMLVQVLTDLAGICKKPADNPAVARKATWAGKWIRTGIRGSSASAR